MSAEAVESGVSVGTRTRTVEAIARITQTQLSTKAFRLFPCRAIRFRRPNELSPISNSIRSRNCESYGASRCHTKNQALIVKFALVLCIKDRCLVRRPVKRRGSDNLVLDNIHLHQETDAPVCCALRVKYGAERHTL